MDRTTGENVLMFQLSMLSTWGKRDTSVAHILVFFQGHMQVNIASSRYSSSLTWKEVKQESNLVFILVATVQPSLTGWASQLCCTPQIVYIVKGWGWVPSCTVELNYIEMYGATCSPSIRSCKYIYFFFSYYDKCVPVSHQSKKKIKNQMFLFLLFCGYCVLKY